MSPFVVYGDQERLAEVMRRFAQHLQHGDVVLMHGDMGAGKTTLARELAAGLGVLRPQRVCSPTYQVAMEHKGRIPMVHVDLFGLAQWHEGSTGAEAGAAFSALGLHEDPRIGHEGVWVVEWGEFWPDPPQPRFELSLHLIPQQEQQRRLDIEARGEVAKQRLKEFELACVP